MNLIPIVAKIFSALHKLLCWARSVANSIFPLVRKQLKSFICLSLRQNNCLKNLSKQTMGWNYYWRRISFLWVCLRFVLTVVEQVKRCSFVEYNLSCKDVINNIATTILWLSIPINMFAGSEPPKYLVITKYRLNQILFTFFFNSSKPVLTEKFFVDWPIRIYFLSKK